MKRDYFYLIIILILAFFLIKQCKSSELVDYENSLKSHIIPVKQAVDIYQEIDEKRIPKVQPVLRSVYQDTSFVDTRFVWFEYDKIKHYLKYLDDIQAENPGQEISGFRFYFAAYPNNAQLKHPGKQTLFIAPTVKHEVTEYNNMNHLPFYIKAISPNNPIKGEFRIIEELLLDYKREDRIESYKSQKIQKAGLSFLNFSSLNFQDETTSVIINEGELSPPPPYKEE